MYGRKCGEWKSGQVKKGRIGSEKAHRANEWAKDILLMTVACAIISTSIFFFLIPSHTTVSGVTGLAIVMSHFFPLSVAQFTMIMNFLLLIVGFAVFGKEFGAKTVYTSVLVPVMLGALEIMFPDNVSLTGDAALDMICHIFFVSIGLSILFNDNASSGGLDIVAKVLNRYFHVELGTSLSISGMLIALSSGLVYDKKTVVLSVLGTYANGLILDHFIFGQTLKKRVCIITKKEEELRKFILRDLHSGATIYEAYGAMNFQKHRELITILTRHEYQKLMVFLNRLDPDAFVTIYNVTEIRYQKKPESLPIDLPQQ